LPTVDLTLTWGVFTRLLALVYVVAFVSLGVEIVAWAGRRGLTPIAPKLARMRADLGPWRAALRHPSLLWLNSSDHALRWLPIAGIVAALLAAAGVASTPMFAAAWIVYLSLDVAIGLTFPWESMLFEAGFLALLLPPLERLPSLHTAQAPEPILMFAFHWLLFRALFGFGKMKFTRDARHEPRYLRGFLISQPMPTPLGWRASRLPAPLLVSSHGLLFVAEMILPFFVFFPGWPRLTAAAGFVALMVSVQAMGNFGFFNLLVSTLSVALLDPRAVTAQSIDVLTSPHGIVLSVVVGWSLLAGLCHLPFNSWVARGWPEWPAWGRLTGVAGWLLALMRATMPFRTVHAYGVFPPRIGPPAKFLPIVEGTRDGIHWETYEYRFMPSTERSRPRFVAPHCPRLDHFALYEGVDLGAGNYAGTIFSQGNPYDFSTVSRMDRLLERLMEPDSTVRRLFGHVPFDGVPVRMRIRLYMFSPTTPREMSATGRYWRRDLIGTYSPERGPDATLFARWLPEAEQFHPDERWARRRVPRIRPLLDARDLECVRGVLRSRPALHWEAFWNDVVPAVRDAERKGWPAVEVLASRLKEQYGPLDLNALDRVRGAVTTAVLERLDPYLLGRRTPRLDVPSYFHASLLAHGVVLDGPERTSEALANPLVLLGTWTPEITMRALRFVAAFAPETIALHARTLRVTSSALPPSPPPPEPVPGFARVLPLLAAAFIQPDESVPVATQRPDGEWVVRMQTPRAAGRTESAAQTVES
jgi:hypothetical protein